MSLNLTPGELEEITGRKRRDAQIRWLRLMGYTFRVNADGRPIVSRRHYEMMMDAVPEKSQDRRVEPDFSALHDG